MYLVSKSGPKCEYRIYIDNNEPVDGHEIYKGHKLGVEDSLLYEILDFRIEKSTNKILFLKYDKIINEIDHKDSTLWEDGKMESISKNLLDSWISLCRSMREKFGDFRKIIITKVYI
jgi:hypothetical protein